MMLKFDKIESKDVHSRGKDFTWCIIQELKELQEYANKKRGEKMKNKSTEHKGEFIKYMDDYNAAAPIGAIAKQYIAARQAGYFHDLLHEYFTNIEIEYQAKMKSEEDSNFQVEFDKKISGLEKSIKELQKLLQKLLGTVKK